MKKEQEKKSQEAISDSQLQNISGGIVIPTPQDSSSCTNISNESACTSRSECKWDDSSKNGKCIFKPLQKY